MKWIRFIAVIPLTAMLLSACALLPPVPTNEQILQAVTASNEAEAEPLELVYDEMEVPQRSPGRARSYYGCRTKHSKKLYRCV